MHLPSGEGRGQGGGGVDTGMPGRISQRKLLCSAESSILESCGRTAGSRMCAVCSQVQELARRHAVCLGEDWRPRPCAGNLGGGPW